MLHSSSQNVELNKWHDLYIRSYVKLRAAHYNLTMYVANQAFYQVQALGSYESIPRFVLTPGRDKFGINILLKSTLSSIYIERNQRYLHSNRLCGIFVNVVAKPFV